MSSLTTVGWHPVIRNALRISKLFKNYKDLIGPGISQKSASVQLLLLGEAIERVDNANVEVSVVRKGASSLVLEVLVKFPG
jgi:hypothetical protein